MCDASDIMGRDRRKPELSNEPLQIRTTTVRQRQYIVISL